MKKSNLTFIFVIMLLLGSTTFGYAQETVTICAQTWMVKNLDVDKYQDGTPILQAKNHIEWTEAGYSGTGAYCYYRDDSATYAATYGKLYNWYAVNDPRGLAPKGWHIPNDAEWSTLSTCLGGDAVAGGAMKEAGTTHWLPPIPPNTAGTNNSGFTGLPGGGRDGGDGAFYSVMVRHDGDWWSATEDGTTNAWCRGLGYIYDGVDRYSGGKRGGLSVRCVRD